MELKVVSLGSSSSSQKFISRDAVIAFAISGNSD